MKKIILKIGGMSCSACSNGLEKYLKKQNGIKDVNVNLVMATASIEYDDFLEVIQIEKYILKAGFESLGILDDNLSGEKTKTTPFVVYGILLGLIMYISMSHMFFLPSLPFINMHDNPTFYSICLFLLTFIFLGYGFDILKSGIKNLLHLMPNMDTLVTVGVLSSFLYSIYGVIMVLMGNIGYVHNLYFESVAFIIYFIKFGRFIDSNSKAKTKDAIKKLVTITPKTAKIKNGENVLEVTIDEVKVGDILVCYPGEKIAVDGVIVDGSSHFDESFITGESKPVFKKIDDRVVAGSMNYDGYILYKADKIGKDSTISEIVRLVVNATNTKAPIALIADKISGYFVPFIISFSFLMFAISFGITKDFAISVDRFVTILVVACPCALGLATPLAIVVSEGLCAKNGILVKSGAILEMLSHIGTVVFDKTGTLTNGVLTISKINNYSNMSDNKLIGILGSLEAKSVHPIAKGIMNYIRLNKIEIDDSFSVKVLDGYGISGNSDSTKYYAGNRKLISKLKIDNPYLKDEKDLSEDQNSIVYIVEDETIIGMVGVKDTIRSEAKKLISELRKMDIDVIMLTGDNLSTAKKMASSVGISKIYADVVPKEKTEVIKKLQNAGKKVMMVGDGINDAPSLLTSDVGVSMGSGTDIAGDTADVILLNDNLLKIVSLIKIGKKTLLNIKENLFWAFLYNICMIPIAAGMFGDTIIINPMIACTFMIVSSLTVIFNALRLRKIKL